MSGPDFAGIDALMARSAASDAESVRTANAGTDTSRNRLPLVAGTPDIAPQDPQALTHEPQSGLREKPFSLSSDPRFFSKESSHGASLEILAAGIRRREGILALMGEVGTGKTTLCQAVLQALDRRIFAAFVPDPFLSREDL